MLWTVMLGELVVNRLVVVGLAVDGVPLRVLMAGRRSLDVIGKWGPAETAEGEVIKGFQKEIAGGWMFLDQ
jgi:hypothetical protein